MKLFCIFTVATAIETVTLVSNRVRRQFGTFQPYDYEDGDGQVNVLAKKVPPRTPDQRLETLERFINEWIDDHLTKLPSYQRKWSKIQFGYDSYRMRLRCIKTFFNHESWKTRSTDNTARMLKAFKDT